MSILAGLWLVAVPVHGLGGLALAYLGREAGLWAAIPAVLGLALAAVSAAVSYGLWARSPWARGVQLGLAVLGLCSPAVLTCILILIYLLRPEVRIQFSGRRLFSELDPAEARLVRHSSSDTAFALSIRGSLLVAILVAGLLGLLACPRARADAPEARAIHRLEGLATAQEAFRSGTCGGYADLQGLIHPSSVIPNYPPGGPPFLEARYGLPEDHGYRFELTLEDPLAARDGCPTHSYRRFAYSASPASGSGTHYRVGPDRVVRRAEGRPAGPEDPPLVAETIPSRPDQPRPAPLF